MSQFKPGGDDGHVEREIRPTVVFHYGHVSVLSNGAVIHDDGYNAWIKEMNELAAAETPDEPETKLDPNDEGMSFDEWDADHGRDRAIGNWRRHPIGSEMNLAQLLSRKFGSLENVEEWQRIMTELDTAQSRHSHLIMHGGDSEETRSELKELSKRITDLRDQSDALFEKIDRVYMPDHDGIYVGDEALAVLKQHPEGTIIYSFDDDGPRPGDSDETVYITQHGDKILRYRLECSEYGMGTSITVESIQDHIKYKEEEAKRWGR